MQPSEVRGRARSLDGRRLRSARTRQLIIEAYLALLRENPRIPTAASIAQRAGYSVRSVFERFPDLHALRVAATDEALLKASAQVAAQPTAGTRNDRLRTHVEARGRICEEWLPLWRALNANQEEVSEMRAYSPDIFSNWSQLAGILAAYDANGPYARVTPTATGVFQLNGTAIQPADTAIYGGLDVITGINRCPGGGVQPIAGSNPFLDNGNLTGKCDPSQVP